MKTNAKKIVLKKNVFSSTVHCLVRTLKIRGCSLSGTAYAGSWPVSIRPTGSQPLPTAPAATPGSSAQTIKGAV